MAKKKVQNHNEEEDSIILPILSLEDGILFPNVPQPIKIDEENLVPFLKNPELQKKDVVVHLKTNPALPIDKQPAKIGVACKIDKIMQIPEMPALVFMMPKYRVYILSAHESEDGTFGSVMYEPPVSIPRRRTPEQKTMIEEIEKIFKAFLKFMPPEPEMKNAINLVDSHSDDIVTRIYAITSVAFMSFEEKYEILKERDFNGLLFTTLSLFETALQKLELQASIHERTHRELTRQQKEAFLRTHLRQIKDELGENDETGEIDELLKRGESKKWSKETYDFFMKEVGKLKRLNINNPEYSVQYSYLDTLLSLPWENYKTTDFSLKKVEDVLNRDHYGLEKVKERVVEQMAVLKLRNDLKSPIICLVGPPGVGKTSIGKSVAEALGREYIRISLGGVHDESEIRGHRRTYIGAMPGRFIHALQKSETGNPLMLLDEIDKVGKDYKGDPSSALLEALDPEQNNTFHDNFIDHPYDLSKVLFIATANDLSTIPAPLLDRMEVIDISGYIPAEKREIALRHLIAKSLANNGFKPKEIKFTPEAIDLIVRYYTREAGVRQLEKKISKILRKIARLKVLGEKYPKKITPPIAEKYLGKHEVNPDSYEGNEFPGVATGLAWTPVGGDILFIETSLSPGKGEKLTLTGNLGDVMKESATIALQYLKANATKFGLDNEIFKKYDVHIHVPEGAVPKDGPSAGITIATSIASAFLDRKIREKTAMTGEITLRGKVLPVGGIKEKIIAAKQAGITRIILSEENRKDIEEIASFYLEGLDFIYVKTLSDVFSSAF